MSRCLLSTKQVMFITEHNSPLLLLQRDDSKQISRGSQSYRLTVCIPEGILHVIRALQYGRKAPPLLLAHGLSRSYEVSIDSTLEAFCGFSLFGSFDYIVS